MDGINLIYMVFILGIFGLMFYSLIRWVVVFIVARDDKARRKKYAIMCLISIVMIAFMMISSFIVNFNHNTM